MVSKMKLLMLSDVHQFGGKWRQLFDAVVAKKPKITAIAGDLYPKDKGIRCQVNFIPKLRKYAEKIREYSELVFITGNDDNSLTLPAIEQGEKDGLWHCVNDKVARIKGLDFAGCPWVPDYPFGYKYWTTRESPECSRICPTQYGDPVILNENNKWETINDLKTYFRSKKSILEHLEETAEKIEDPKRTIWLIHAPPANLGLDVCANGDRVGSYAILKFLKDFQPLLSFHGHIHESPEYNGHKWVQKLDNTFCVQPGQLDRKLYYVEVEIVKGKISGMKHSIYGESRYEFS